MNNKGLTLIELLAVIVIIALVSLIIYPQVHSILKDTNKTASDAQKSSIREAAIEYTNDNIGLGTFFANESQTEETITYNTLFEEGYITGKTNNAETGNELDLHQTKVIITRSGTTGKYKYNYKVVLKDKE